MILPGVGALTTTPVAPCISAYIARFTTRLPVVSPPPTPTNTGRSDAISSACVMIGCGVNGYTAMTASALTLRMMARSVENTSDLIRFPNTTMPLHSWITDGTRSANCRSVPSIGVGMRLATWTSPGVSTCRGVSFPAVSASAAITPPRLSVCSIAAVSPSVLSGVSTARSRSMVSSDSL